MEDSPLHEFARVLRPGAPLILMGDRDLSSWDVALDSFADKLSFIGEMTVLWRTGKPRGRNFGSLTMSIRWYARTGARYSFNPDFRRVVQSNVIVCDQVPADDRATPSQKPVELTNFLVSVLTEDSEYPIVDPYCGSGSTLVSAAMCGRNYVGFDDIEECATIAATRAARHELEAANLQPIHLWVNGKMIEIGDE
jgi:DNA modification methylase